MKTRLTPPFTPVEAAEAGRGVPVRHPGGGGRDHGRTPGARAGGHPGPLAARRVRRDRAARRRPGRADRLGAGRRQGHAAAAGGADRDGYPAGDYRDCWPPRPSPWCPGARTPPSAWPRTAASGGLGLREVDPALILGVPMSQPDTGARQLARLRQACASRCCPNSPTSTRPARPSASPP